MTNGKHPFIFSGKSKDGAKEGSYKKHAKYQGRSSKTNDERKMVVKKTARVRKPKIERRQIETVRNSRDKREKNYRIAEKRKIDIKG